LRTSIAASFIFAHAHLAISTYFTASGASQLILMVDRALNQSSSRFSSDLDRRRREIKWISQILLSAIPNNTGGPLVECR
jgi:hypothetical protein